MTQPIWKLLYSTDTEALYQDETGVYDPELAVLDEYETKRGTSRYYEFRFPIPKCVLADASLPQSCFPAMTDENGHVEWFSSDLASVANSCDHPTIAHDLCSDDPKVRARAYASIGWYHGFDNFDSEPQDLTESAVANWPDLDGKPEVCISTNGDDDGYVTLYCDDVEACRDERSVLGSTWEISDNTLAYTTVMERTGLVTALEAEGRVDTSRRSRFQVLAREKRTHERGNAGKSP